MCVATGRGKRMNAEKPLTEGSFWVWHSREIRESGEEAAGCEGPNVQQGVVGQGISNSRIG